jgi:hypothetical protein
MWKTEEGSWQCAECEHQSSFLTNMKNHIEAHHISVDYRYNCPSCGKLFKTKNAFQTHKSRLKHKKDSCSDSRQRYGEPQCDSSCWWEMKIGVHIQHTAKSPPLFSTFSIWPVQNNLKSMQDFVGPMVSRFVRLKSIFSSTEFVAERTEIATGLDMVRLYMLPQPHSYFSHPTTVPTLPLSPYFQHLPLYILIFKLYKEKE